MQGSKDDSGPIFLRLGSLCNALAWNLPYLCVGKTLNFTFLTISRLANTLRFYSRHPIFWPSYLVHGTTEMLQAKHELATPQTTLQVQNSLSNHFDIWHEGKSNNTFIEYSNASWRILCSMHHVHFKQRMEHRMHYFIRLKGGATHGLVMTIINDHAMRFGGIHVYKRRRGQQNLQRQDLLQWRNCTLGCSICLSLEFTSSHGSCANKLSSNFNAHTTKS